MSLNWSWKEKCGEATILDTMRDEEPKPFNVSLYTGNAYLIMLYEWEEDGKELWNMFSFWADKDHMNHCLGLNKKKDPESYNIYDTPYRKLTKIRLDKDKCGHIKDIIPALVKAFDNITIEVYTSKEEN